MDIKALVNRLSRLSNKSDFHQLMGFFSPARLLELDQSQTALLLDRMAHFNYFKPEVMKALYSSGRLEVSPQQHPSRFVEYLRGICRLKSLPPEDKNLQALLGQLAALQVEPSFSLFSEEQLVLLIESVTSKVKNNPALYDKLVQMVLAKLSLLSSQQITRVLHCLF